MLVTRGLPIILEKKMKKNIKKKTHPQLNELFNPMPDKRSPTSGFFSEIAITTIITTTFD